MPRAGVGLDGGVVGGGVAGAAGLAAVVTGRLEAAIGLEIGEEGWAEGWLLYATSFVWLALSVWPVALDYECIDITRLLFVVAVAAVRQSGGDVAAVASCTWRACSCCVPAPGIYVVLHCITTVTAVGASS